MSLKHVAIEDGLFDDFLHLWARLRRQPTEEELQQHREKTSAWLEKEESTQE